VREPSRELNADELALVAGVCLLVGADDIILTQPKYPLEQARPLGQTLRLFLGRRHSFSGPAGRRCAVPAVL